MKTKTILSILALASFALASCSNEESGDGDAKDKNAGGSADEYPLTTCVVSGEELGSMGDAVVHEHEGTTVKFCCKSCIPEFEKDPAKYIAKLKK